MGSVLIPQDGMLPKIKCPVINFGRSVGQCMRKCPLGDVNWCKQIKNVGIDELDAAAPLLSTDAARELWADRRAFFITPVKDERSSKEDPFDLDTNGGGGLVTTDELGIDAAPEPAAAAPEPDPEPEPETEEDVPVGPYADDEEIPGVQRTMADADDDAMPDFDKTAEEEAPAPKATKKKSKKKSSKKKKGKKKTGKAATAEEAPPPDEDEPDTPEDQEEDEEEGAAGAGPKETTKAIITVLDTWCQIHEFPGTAADPNVLMRAAAEIRAELLERNSGLLQTMLEEGVDDEDPRMQEVTEIVEALKDEVANPTRIFHVKAEYRAQVVTTLEQV
jgi:hypothetical protein